MHIGMHGHPRVHLHIGKSAVCCEAVEVTCCCTVAVLRAGCCAVMSAAGHSAWQDASLLHGGVCDAVDVLCIRTDPLSGIETGCISARPCWYAGPIVGGLARAAMMPIKVAMSTAVCRAAIVLPSCVQTGPTPDVMYLCTNILGSEAITDLLSSFSDNA